MIWGAVTSAGVGPFCFIKSKINAAIYQEILEYVMFPSADKLFGEADFLFQLNGQFNNTDEVKAAIKETCASIVPQQCHRLIASMPHLTDAGSCA